MPTFIDCFCDAQTQKIMVKGEPVCFDFSYRFGPLVTDAEGNPLDRQPGGERDPFWRPFEKWLAAYQKTNPERVSPPRPLPGDHLDRRAKDPRP